MKRLLLIILLAAITVQAGWWRGYSGDVGNCIQLTSDGNYVFSGSVFPNLVLYKVDTLGDIIWSHTYGKSDTWLWRWIEETSDGGYIIAPRTPSLLKINAQGDSVWAKDYGFDSHCVQETSDGGFVFTSEYDELVLVRTDSLGDTLWTRRFTEPSNAYNVGYFIQVTDDGGYIITGSTEYADEYVNWSNLWLVKTDSFGNKMWSKVYGNDTDSKGYCVRQTKDGGYIISGVSPQGLWLLKTNANGDTLWTKTYSYPSGGGAGFSVQLTQDSGYIVSGVTETFTAVNLYAGTAKLWLLKMNEQGDTVWSRTYSGDDWAVGRCVQQTADSGYVVLGYASGIGIYLLKTDSLGLLSISEEPITESDETWWVNYSVGNEIVLRYSKSPQGFNAVIFDATGRKVDELYSKASNGSIAWGACQTPGVYFIQAREQKNKRSTVKVVLTH